MRGLRGGVDVEIVGWVVDALRCEMGHGAGAVFWTAVQYQSSRTSEKRISAVVAGGASL